MGHSHHDQSNQSLKEARQELGRRLDDLRGLGLLPAWSETMVMEGEGALLKLSLSLVDLLESAQRRVIETSIQLLSLRELVSALLNMRTPDAVSKTVTTYLHKAFDHESVLVGIRNGDDIHGWVAGRSATPRYQEFSLRGRWSGAVRDALFSEGPLRAGKGAGLLDGTDVPESLNAFCGASGVVYPLVGSGGKVMGVVGVKNQKEHAAVEGMDAEILQSLVEAVSTVLENVLLDEDVRRQEAFRKDILGSMTSGLVAVDLSGTILTVNPRACTLAGRDASDLQGATPQVLGRDGQSLHHLIKETLNTREPVLRAESYLERPDATRIPVACSTALLHNPEREVYGAMITFEDLSLIKAMEERIRQLDRLAALGRFTSGVAHEIRNPLAGIAAGVQYLAKRFDNDPEQDENIQFMTQEIRRLDRIVEDLFRVTHPLPPRKVPEKPGRLLELAARSLGERPTSKNLKLTTDCGTDVPAVPVDADQIQQVLINLMKNAVESTPEGGRIEATAYLADVSGKGPHVVFEITDTGPGIPAEDLPHIFEPFYTKGKAGGTGLGLYVSHGIVERHGGELLADNTREGGAVFFLRIPLTSYNTMEMAG